MLENTWLHAPSKSYNFALINSVTIYPRKWEELQKKLKMCIYQTNMWKRDITKGVQKRKKTSPYFRIHLFFMCCDQHGKPFYKTTQVRLLAFLQHSTWHGILGTINSINKSQQDFWHQKQNYFYLSLITLDNPELLWFSYFGTTGEGF